jgi:SAM-dependent methyltransferase
MNDSYQDVRAKRGEITFRRTLSEQELGDEICIPEAFSREEIMSVLADSMEETRRAFNQLVARPISISPFLELGAERGDRSFFLCNEFGAQGFAFDLSLDALQFGDRFIEEFGFSEVPFRICGDAYSLPFRGNSFPFVFCFATLHHFPDPLPIVQEALRVLQDGGYFYFDREPTRGRIAIRLWTRHGYKLSRVETLLKQLGILGFVSEGGGMEREYGILENTFPLETWVGLTTLFDKAEMQVNQTLKIQFDPSQFSVKQRLGQVVGGVTSGLCRVKKDEPPLSVNDWTQMLRCPTCSTSERESGLTLLPSGKGLQCVHCGITYPQHNGVLLLLPQDLQQKLYPDWGPVFERSGTGKG